MKLEPKRKAIVLKNLYTNLFVGTASIVVTYIILYFLK